MVPPPPWSCTITGSSARYCGWGVIGRLGKGKGKYFTGLLCKPLAWHWIFSDLHQLFRWHVFEETKRACWLTLEEILSGTSHPPMLGTTPVLDSSMSPDLLHSIPLIMPALPTHLYQWTFLSCHWVRGHPVLSGGILEVHRYEHFWTAICGRLNVHSIS